MDASLVPLLDSDSESEGSSEGAVWYKREAPASVTDLSEDLLDELVERDLADEDLSLLQDKSLKAN